jgi:hypothetical protein
MEGLERLQHNAEILMKLTKVMYEHGSDNSMRLSVYQTATALCNMITGFVNDYELVRKVKEL